jgi:hypothetical protein
MDKASDQVITTVVAYSWCQWWYCCRNGCHENRGLHGGQMVVQYEEMKRKIFDADKMRGVTSRYSDIWITADTRIKGVLKGLRLGKRISLGKADMKYMSILVE